MRSFVHIQVHIEQTQTQHVVERTGVFNNHQTYFLIFFLITRTDRQPLLLKYLRYLKKLNVRFYDFINKVLQPFLSHRKMNLLE